MNRLIGSIPKSLFITEDAKQLTIATATRIYTYYIRHDIVNRFYKIDNFNLIKGYKITNAIVIQERYNKDLDMYEPSIELCNRLNNTMTITFLRSERFPLDFDLEKRIVYKDHHFTQPENSELIKRSWTWNI